MGKMLMGLYVLKIHISKISIFGSRTIEQKPATVGSQQLVIHFKFN